ncbi:helix-turn-helix domain-containing protein [Haladaptatus halobius]|uniref:helix-turn-helix domain-containing protein n=1 Tax=Haladaptatus halobius TaxID=2884875 RepID=UPI001D0BC595|nr:helix-turn-helix domain-containing protein [Haladaptatus halobius]
MPDGTVAELAIPADEFALRQTLTTIDGLTVEDERIAAHNGDSIMPYVWLRNKNQDMTEAALADDPTVEQVELLADLKSEWLYKMEWVDQIETLIQILVEEDGTILAATGNEDWWMLRILFPDREALSQTYEYCQEQDLSLDVRQIHQLEDGRQDRFGLTDEQQEILVLAAEHGYYEVPREVSAEELADDVGISHQAVSERLRRGHDKLVTNVLLTHLKADHQ